jgi:hypothetical protein
MGPRRIEEGSVYAARGITAHEFLRSILGGMAREEALARIPSDDPGRAICEEIDITALPAGGNLEIALAWNPDTSKGRVLGYDLGRDYIGAGADRVAEFVGSFDFAGQHTQGHGVLVDYKTGWGALAAKDSWQLRGGAVFLADTYGLDAVEAAHMYQREGEEPRWDVVRYDAMDLAAARDDLRALAKHLRSRKRQGLVVEGPHCKFCPVYAVCPTKVGLSRSLVKLNTIEALTTDKAREAILQLERFEEVAKRVWLELEAFADVTPIDLGDGRTMKRAPGRSADSVVKPSLALDVVAGICDDEAAREAVKTSKGAIEDAVRKWALDRGKTIAPVQREVFARLRELEAIQKLAGKEAVRIVKTGAADHG